MFHEQVCHGLVAVNEGFFAHGALGVGMWTIRVCAVHQQPFGPSEMVVGHGIAEQVVDGSALQYTVGRARGSPSIQQPAPLALRPQSFQPVRVVARDRGVVERLRVVGACAALDQQGGERLGLRVRRLNPFAQANDTGQDFERVVPSVVPAGVRVGAPIEQCSRNLQRMRVAPGQARIGQIEERLPAQRAAFAVGGSGIAGQTPFDLGEISGRHGDVQIFGADIGPPREHALRGSPIALPRCRPQYDLDMLRTRASRQR